MTNLEKNIINLQEKIYGLNSPDISESFLSDSEVAKNIILSKNDKMSKADADIMIDGEISEKTKTSLAAEIRARRLGENTARTAAAAGAGLAGVVGAGGLAGGLAGAGGLDGTGLVGSDESTVGGLDTSNIDLTQGQNILSDSVGNNFTTGNPIDDMLEDKQPSLSFSKESIDEEIQREVDNEIAKKEETAKFARDNKIYPLPKDSTFHTESKKIKTQVREKFMMLIKEQKELIQDLSKTAIESGNAIAAASVLVAPVSFNVPAAIVLVIKVIDGISKIISKVMNIILQLEPLKFLPLLLPKDSFDSITAPINTSILSIVSILDVTGGLQKLIQSLMGKLKDSLNPENLQSQIRELKKQISDKEEEKNDLIKNAATEKDINLKSEEIKELKDRLKKLLEGPELPEMENGEFKTPSSFDDLLKSIDNTLETNKNSISTLNLQLFDYVYDVRLSDNTIVRGITEEELEYYKQKYVIIADNENSD